jgi:hypothetical protein
VIPVISGCGEMNACIPDSADLSIVSRRGESRAGRPIELGFEGRPCRGLSRNGCPVRPG